MKKGFWKELSCTLVGYLIFAYFISSNWGTFKYLPGFVVIGSLGTFFVLGSLIHKKTWSMGAMLAIAIPHVIADIFYVIGLSLKSSVFIGIFRQIVPHVQSSMGLIDKVIPGSMLPSTKIAIATVVMIPLSYLSFRVGASLRESLKSINKWIYNNIIVWMAHFALFVSVMNIATVFPQVLTEEKVALMFAFISTLMLFVVYFFAGRACLTIKNPIGQFTSMLSVTVTNLILYIGMLFLIIDTGVFERYILPIGTSFIGTICKKIGILTGASCNYFSQYGFIATAIMIFIPVVILYVGKLASMPDKQEVSTDETILTEA